MQGWECTRQNSSVVPARWIAAFSARRSLTGCVRRCCRCCRRCWCLSLCVCAPALAGFLLYSKVATVSCWDSTIQNPEDSRAHRKGVMDWMVCPFRVVHNPDAMDANGGLAFAVFSCRCRSRCDHLLSSVASLVRWA